MRRYLLLMAIVVLAGLGGWLWWNKNKAAPKTPEAIHYHAGFQVYENNQLINFSDSKYMKIEPCRVDEAAPEDDQLEKAHLHDNVGDVVHMHRAGAVWGDLFTNINFPIEASASGYVNNQSVADILHYPIKPYDSVVILEGTNDHIDEKLAGAVTKEHILGVEAKSENCGN